MDRTSLSEICAVLKGRRVGAWAEGAVDRVVIDSREAEPGSLFFALKGERADGFGYVNAAFESGATAAVVPIEAIDDAARWIGPVILVRDSLDALQKLASWQRDRLEARVIGITGSVGKTTTKDMIAAALQARKRVVKAPRSFNNAIGVSLTLLLADRATEVVVAEVGTNAPGEIDALGAVLRPDIVVMTAIGYSHLAGLGSIDAVTSEKASLLKHLRPGGVSFFNGDDIRCRGMASAQLSVCRDRDAVVRVGFGHCCDIRAEVLELMGSEPGSRSRARTERGLPLTLGVPGQHNLRNALMAVSVSVECGVPARLAARQMARFEATEGRLAVREFGGLTVIDDSYNANPSSMRAALECFALYARSRQRWVVLGSMLELGESSLEHHRAVGEMVAQLGFAGLITVGEEAREIAVGARGRGRRGPTVSFATVAEFNSSQLCAELAGAGVAVLVKGSRGVALDRAVETFSAHASARESQRSVA